MNEQQFTPPSTVFMKWKLADEGQLRIQKWSQFPFDGAISYAMSAEDATGATPTPVSIVSGIRAAALEEAAKIADEHVKAHCSTPDGDQTSAMRLGASSIASAIRALSTTSTEGE